MALTKKYWDIKPILSKHATYNIIIGKRSNGKTYGVLKHGLEKAFNGGGEIGYIRRFSKDVKGSLASDVFSAFNSDGTIKKLSHGKYDMVYYRSGKYYGATVDEKGKFIYSDFDCIGHTFSLAETEHTKSISYPNITTILFDEFLTTTYYLKDEFILFMNTLSTIIRDRTNVEIFMCGNTITQYCPYFEEMGLTNISKMEMGDIDLYTYGKSDLTVAVERCTNTSAKKSDKFFAFNNPKLEMITSGKWQLDVYPHLLSDYSYKDILFTYFIEFDGKIYQCEIIDNGDCFTYIHEKTTEIKHPDTDLIYTLEIKQSINYNNSVFKPINSLQKKVMWFFVNNKVFYQNNFVGDAISNYLKICKTM